MKKISLLGIVFFGLILTLGALAFFAKPIVKSKIEKKIQQELSDSDSLSYQALELHFFPPKITINELFFESKDQGILIELESAQITMSIRSLFSDIQLDEIYLSNGRCELKDATKDEKANTDSIHFLVNTVKIENVDFKMKTTDFHIKKAHFPLEININGADWSVITNQNKVVWQIENLHFPDIFDHHDFNIKQIGISDGVTKMQYAEIKCRENKRFFDNKSHLFTAIDWKIDSLQFDFTIDTIRTDFGLHIPLLAVYSHKMELYQNSGLPASPSKKPLLPTIVYNIPFSFAMDSLHMDNGVLIYEERNSDDGEIARLDIDQWILNGRDWTNRDSSAEMLISSDMRMMKHARLKLACNFKPKSQHDRFHFTGQMYGASFSKFNAIIGPATGISFEEGLMQKGFFSFYGSDHDAKGTMKLYYTDLKIGRYGKDDLGNRILMWATNLVVKSDGEGEEATIEKERQQNRSMINFWWQCLQSGLKESVVRRI